MHPLQDIRKQIRVQKTARKKQHAQPVLCDINVKHLNLFIVVYSNIYLTDEEILWLQLLKENFLRGSIPL